MAQYRILEEVKLREVNREFQRTLALHSRLDLRNTEIMREKTVIEAAIAVAAAATVATVAVLPFDMHPIVCTKKVIKKTDLVCIVVDCCIICSKRHTKGSVYTLNCGHIFGQECFTGWVKSCRNKAQNANCPTCKQDVKSIFSYRRRKYSQPIQKSITAFINDPININHDRLARLETELQQNKIYIQYLVESQIQIDSERRVIAENIQRMVSYEATRVRNALALAATAATAARMAVVISISKTLKTEELASILPDVCGICLEKHTKGSVCTLNCGHEFGQECFTEWKNACLTNERNITCPSCRQRVWSLTRYR